MIDYYFSKLSPREQGGYLALLDNVRRFCPKTDLLRWKLTPAGACRAFTALCLDHPELIWLSWEVTASELVRGGGAEPLVAALSCTYTLTPKEAKKQMWAVEVASAGLISALSNRKMNPWEKVCWLHDRLIYHTDYDKSEQDDHRWRADNHSIYGVLVRRIAVCEGYAETMTYLLRQVGVDCITCFGGKRAGYGGMPTVHSHAWNCITINGVSMEVDTTWDDLGNHRRERGITHQYFGLTRQEMERCHGFSAYLPQPEGREPRMNYFHRRGLTATSLEQVQRLVAEAVSHRNSYVELRVIDPALRVKMQEKSPLGLPNWLPRRCSDAVERYSWYQPNHLLGWVRMDLYYR